MKAWLIASSLSCILACFGVKGTADDIVTNPYRDSIIPSAEFVQRAVDIGTLIIDMDSLDESQWGDFTPLLYESTESDTEIAVGLADDTIWIAFLGTDDTSDAWNNLRLTRTTYRPTDTFQLPGRVHSGWYSELFSDENDFWTDTSVELINLLMTPDLIDLDLVVTGHSRGAAFSILYGVYLAQTFPSRRVSSVSFGTPRVGNADFRDVAEDIENFAVYRVVYQEDAVARVPPTIFGYRHIGHLLYYQVNSFAAYWNQDGLGTTYAGVDDSDWNIRLDFDFLDPTNDHAWENYVDVVDGAVEGSIPWPDDFEVYSEPYCCRRFLWLCRSWCT